MYKINKISTDTAPFLQMTRGIAKLPKSLYLCGKLPEISRPSIAIVGTRKPSRYGQEITYRLAYDLASRGVVIVSGLALGVDAIAHRAALDAGGTTIAVMPGSPDHFYPRTNHKLAECILAEDGALISEYPPDTQIYASHFIARNRIVAAIANGLLVTEAAIKSGTIHTAGFALDYGRPVMAVPGEVTNPMSAGTNQLIATGARLITTAADAMAEIGIAQEPTQMTLPIGETPQETAIIKLIARGVRDAEELRQLSDIEPAVFSQTLTMLELTQKIRPLGGNQWGLM